MTDAFLVVGLIAVSVIYAWANLRRLWTRR